MTQEAGKKVAENSQDPVPDHVRGWYNITTSHTYIYHNNILDDYESKAVEYWDGFYHQHHNRLATTSILKLVYY